MKKESEVYLHNAGGGINRKPYGTDESQLLLTDKQLRNEEE